MSELLLTCSIDEVEEGQVFSKSLPRHVTVWQYFTLPDFHRKAFTEEVGDTVADFPPLEIVGADDAEFGPNNNTPVRRIKALGEGATLITLHMALGASIDRYGGTVRNPEWAYEKYNPHVTYVDGRALDEGEPAILHTLELIEKLADSRDKIVRKVWEFEER